MTAYDDWRCGSGRWADDLDAYQGDDDSDDENEDGE